MRCRSLTPAAPMKNGRRARRFTEERDSATAPAAAPGRLVLSARRGQKKRKSRSFSLRFLPLAFAHSRIEKGDE